MDSFRHNLARPARFERAAFRLGGERSILLSYEGRGGAAAGRPPHLVFYPNAAEKARGFQTT